MKLVVNGKVLLGAISGIERTSWEILKRWDKIVGLYDGLEIEIVIPKGHKEIAEAFKSIKVVEYGAPKNLTLWQQFYLPIYLKKTNAVYVGLANSAPMLINKGYVLLHDISCLKNKHFYSKKTRCKFVIETRHVTRKPFKLITVSHFSAREISNECGIPRENIFVIGNGWEHIIDVVEDEEILNKYKLKKKAYYFSLSSLAPNKNFKWIMETAKLNPQQIFVVGGGFKKNIYGNVNYTIPHNVIMLGRISDNEAKALMSHCKAFLFPTLYEGFGIPPLEAYATGAVSIVSDTEVMHEIYGDAVAYIDEKTPCNTIDSIGLPIHSQYAELLKKHSWDKYAKELLCYIQASEKESWY